LGIKSLKFAPKNSENYKKKLCLIEGYTISNLAESSKKDQLGQNQN
jgi:hypothetical protein